LVGVSLPSKIGRKVTYFVNRLRAKSHSKQLGAQTNTAAKSSTQVIFEPLEPRLLMSADPVLGVASAVEPVVVATAEPTVIGVGLLNDSNTDRPAVQQESARMGSVTAAETQARHEVVFVDSRVDDYEQFLQDFLSRTEDERRIEVRILDPKRAGIEQIGQALAGYGGLAGSTAMRCRTRRPLSLLGATR
jgi:hypothetical protein